MTSARTLVTDTSTHRDQQDVSKKQQLVTGPVVIYNILCLLPIDKHLAANYVYACFIDILSVYKFVYFVFIELTVNLFVCHPYVTDVL